MVLSYLGKNMLQNYLQNFKKDDFIKIISIDGDPDDIYKLAIYGFRPGGCFYILRDKPRYILKNLFSSLTLCVRMDNISVICEPYDGD